MIFLLNQNIESGLKKDVSNCRPMLVKSNDYTGLK